MQFLLYKTLVTYNIINLFHCQAAPKSVAVFCEITKSLLRRVLG